MSWKDAPVLDAPAPTAVGPKWKSAPLIEGAMASPMAERFAYASPEIPDGQAVDPGLGVALEQKAVAERYNQLPWPLKIAQSADDIARIGANAATLGYADKIAGALSGTGKEAERAKTEAARTRAGSAGVAADVLGTVAPLAKLAKVGVTTARLVPSTLKGVKGLLARTGAMATDGAIVGATSATGNDTDIGTGAALGAAGGAAGNVAGEALGATVGKVAGIFNKKPAVAALDELRMAQKAAYDASEAAGVIYTPSAVRRIAKTLQKELYDLGYHPKNQPGLSGTFDELKQLSQQNVTLKGMDTLRQLTSGGYVMGNKKNNMMVAKAIDLIDEVTGAPRQGEVLFGDRVAGIAALKEARRLTSRIKKAEKVEYQVDRGLRNAAASGSGGNIDNAIRQRVNRILDDPRGFSKDEITAMRKVVDGTNWQKAFRLVGKLSPAGNGLMLMLHALGAASSGGLTLPLAAVGYGSKKTAEALTKGNVKELERIIRAGGQRSAALAPPNAVQLLAQSKREALARALMGSSVSLGGLQ